MSEESAINVLRLIDNELGSVNFSSHKQMREAIEGSQAMAQAYLESIDNWQPIATAPKDGRTIIVSWDEDGSNHDFAMWSDRPVCMGGPTVYNRPGWAVAPEGQAGTNLPLDEPLLWKEYSPVK